MYLLFRTFTTRLFILVIFVGFIIVIFHVGIVEFVCLFVGLLGGASPEAAHFPLEHLTIGESSLQKDSKNSNKMKMSQQNFPRFPKINHRYNVFEKWMVAVVGGSTSKLFVDKKLMKL